MSTQHLTSRTEVWLAVVCPVSHHTVGEYEAPTASGSWRYVCRRCQPKRYVILRLYGGKPEITTEPYHGD